MIVSQQKPLDEILSELDGISRVFLIGCAKCATVCKAGGEEEVWQMQESLTAVGREITGSIVIDEVCHMLRTARDLRSRKEMVDEAEAIVVLACGAGVQSVSATTSKRTLAGLDTKFLGNIKRLGQFEQKCSLCGECLLSRTGGICPVTVCPKSLLNGPCGGMDNGRCEVDLESECAWKMIFDRLSDRGDAERIKKTVSAKDNSTRRQPGRLKLDK
ncbi:methylenetetrahydrofolate reductase C-terminal domain-containing protein [Geobacter pelophilus]|uniref:Methylenetetrahydrofolate reductase C-terminal domain-containing protein n=1 Tax=Geoanaerobacter pelophilus TaxID=60036 RepID=A0AAW4KVS5_9BACT|nr:methylenetetrahydrofolate reductase C-terminal domain-containing protein [Geoanaerobacter pelophilus]MBT0662764.1 methylenetetrahydrofolate reductase C-terminal domain-containing protein [Geoanaerobacter pelophilus]